MVWGSGGEQENKMIDRGFRDSALYKIRLGPIHPPPRDHNHVSTWTARSD